MRAAVALLILGACGRVRFEPLHDGGAGATGDAGDGGGGAAARLFYVSGDGATAPTELFDVNPASGQLTLLGTLPMTYGEADGLAVWDANHLYMTSYSGTLVEITLSPFGSRLLNTDTSQYSAADRLGNQLVVIDDGLRALVYVTPDPYSIDNIDPLFDGVGQVVVDGGDLVVTSPTDLLWWTNIGQLSYVALNGTVTAINTDAAAPYIVGIARLGGVIYTVTRDTSELWVLDPTTGARSSPVTLCVACPTPYVGSFGDLAAGP